MVDKPGVITPTSSPRSGRLQRETGRIWSVNFSERFEVRAMTRAQELVAAGAIGRVVQTVGFGPHRLNRHLRPAWFFDPAQAGGILADIASHQIDQFLVFTGSEDAEIVASAVANHANPETPDVRGLRRDPAAQRARPAATSGSTGTRPTACRPGATAAARSSAPRATSSCANTSTSPAARAPTTCSWSTAQGTRHIDCSAAPLALLRAPDRRRLRAHRDRDAPGALLQGLRARARGAGGGRAAALRLRSCGDQGGLPYCLARSSSQDLEMAE